MALGAHKARELLRSNSELLLRGSPEDWSPTKQPPVQRSTSLASAPVVELTRFRGHLISLEEKGVYDARASRAVPAGSSGGRWWSWSEQGVPLKS